MGFSFCPTRFASFFGLLVPLALACSDRLRYPALFALGTALPLLLAFGLLVLGGGSLRRYTGHIAGLHDTPIYWLL